ncbi:MAG: hypothetical protein ACI802_003519 [Candidatus Paceibacteria bacterium]|jgi:hypothetical protein
MTANDGLRPYKPSLFEPLGQQAQTIFRGPQYFDRIATAATEHKDMVIERIGCQCSFYLGSQSMEATAHVRDTGGDPDPRADKQAGRSWVEVT